MLFPLPLAAASLLVASTPNFAEADRLLEKKDCDGLVTLSGKLQASEDEGRDLSWARALVQGGNLCRRNDPVLALALTDRAMTLAPADYGVITAHAETLLTLDQRSEAADLLDQAIKDNPEGALRARYLRAELAHAEHEPERVVQLLAPIAADPEYGERAQRLLEKSRASIQAREQAKEQVREEEARLASAARAAEEAAKKPLTASGTEVWSVRGTVKSGGSRSFKTKGLQAGLSYELIAVGQCTAPKKKKKGVSEDVTRLLFGTDFRVSVGGLDSRPIKVGFSAESNRILFRAPHDNPQIQIEDRSFQRDERKKGSLKCTIGDLAVRVP